MATVLFLLSAILFHLPSGIYKDTFRRFKRMELYNPDKAFSFEVQNGNPLENNSITGLVLLSSLLLALIPLILGLDFNWIIIIIANTLFSYFIAPMIAFVVYPKDAIYTNKVLKLKTIQYIGLAVILLIIGLITR
jgi:hypothetical protein